MEKVQEKEGELQKMEYLVNEKIYSGGIKDIFHTFLWVFLDDS